MLRATAVVVTWLRRNGCQQARLFLIGVMVVHVPSAYPPATQQEKSCGDGQQEAPSPMPCLGEHRVGCETTGSTMPLVPLGRPVSQCSL